MVHIWEALRQIWRFIITIAANNQPEIIVGNSAQLHKGCKTITCPLQIFQDQEKWLRLPHQNIHDRERESACHGSCIQGSRIWNSAFENHFNIRNEIFD